MKIPRIIPAALAALLLLPSALAHPQSEYVEHVFAQQTSKSTKSTKPSSSKSKSGAPVTPESELASPDRWPTQVPAPKNTRLRVKTDRDDKKSGLSRYETLNFQFTSEVPLDEEAQEAVGRLFETAYAAVVAMSKSLPIERATRKRPAKNKFRAELYKSVPNYIAAGGPAGSAGVFTHRSRTTKGKKKESDIIGDKVMMPIDNLGINTDGSVATTDIDSHTLVHEITHQFTCLNNLPVWANEGFSEYVGYIPYDDGVLDFDKNFEGIVLEGQRRMRRSGEIKYPFTLEDFFLMEKDEMYDYMGNSVDTYYLSLMCVTYFVHMGDEAGVRAFKAYLRDLLKGKDNDKKTIRKLYARLRTGEAVQKDFVESWAKHGVKVTFAEPKSGKKSRR